MIVWAAIDLREGRVVQLVGGNPDDERISRPNPVDVARAWVAAGMNALHIVDLDAALGIGSNAAAIRDIIAAVAGSATVQVQVGGGVRDEQRVAELLDSGAERVVVGTRAVEDAGWRVRVAEMFPGKVVVAADMRDGRIVTRGWTVETGTRAEDFVRELEPLQLAAILITDVTREGRMSGIDIARFRQLAGASRHAVIAAGGIRDILDVTALAEAGAAGAVLGMSLYTGRITPQQVVQELGA